MLLFFVPVFLAALSVAKYEEGTKCYAPVVCSHPKGTAADWLAIYPRQKCYITAGNSSAITSNQEDDLRQIKRDITSLQKDTKWLKDQRPINIEMVKDGFNSSQRKSEALQEENAKLQKYSERLHRRIELLENSTGAPQAENATLRGELERLDRRITSLQNNKQKNMMERLLSTDENLREAVCYMGIKNGRIPNSDMTASSEYDYRCTPHLGRLDNKPQSALVGSWCTLINNVGEWIQVDFQSPLDVAGVITQGRPQAYNQWVTSYKITCGNTVDAMTPITEDGSDKIFSGNRDMESKVYNRFPKPLTCRYIRIYPQTYNDHMSMRIEFIHGDCYDSFKL